MKNRYNIVGISILSAFLAIVVSSLVLPSFLTEFEETLDSLEFVDSVNLISWASILITIIALSVAIILQSRVYSTKYLAYILLLSTLFTFIILCAGSYIYLGAKQPELFQNTSILEKVLNFYSYPTLVSIYLEDFQPIWLISTTLLITIFNIQFFYLLQ